MRFWNPDRDLEDNGGDTGIEEYRLKSRIAVVSSFVYLKHPQSGSYRSIWRRLKTFPEKQDWIEQANYYYNCALCRRKDGQYRELSKAQD